MGWVLQREPAALLVELHVSQKGVGALFRHALKGAADGVQKDGCLVCFEVAKGSETSCDPPGGLLRFIDKLWHAVKWAGAQLLATAVQESVTVRRLHHDDKLAVHRVHPDLDHISCKKHEIVWDLKVLVWSR